MEDIGGAGGNNKLDLKEIGQEGVECTEAAQNKDQWQTSVNVVMDLQFP